jgi:hypothetical protein
MSNDNSEQVEKNINPAKPTSEEKNYLQHLLNNPLKIADFEPMKRNEIYSKE